MSKRTPKPRKYRRTIIDTPRMLRRLSQTKYGSFRKEIEPYLSEMLDRFYCSYCDVALTLESSVIEHCHGRESGTAVDAFRGWACRSCNAREAWAVKRVETAHGVSRNDDPDFWPTPARRAYVTAVSEFVVGVDTPARRSRACRVLRLE